MGTRMAGITVEPPISTFKYSKYFSFGRLLRTLIPGNVIFVRRNKARLMIHPVTPTPMM